MSSFYLAVDFTRVFAAAYTATSSTPRPDVEVPSKLPRQRRMKLLKLPDSGLCQSWQWYKPENVGLFLIKITSFALIPLPIQFERVYGALTLRNLHD